MRLRTLAVFLPFVLSSISIYAQKSDVSQHLRDQCQGKTFVLREFYAGKSLRYDAAGSLAGGATAGDWTTDGFVRVNDIRLSRQRLTVKAARVPLDPDYTSGFELFKAAGNVEIEADLGVDNPSTEQIDAVLSRIFLTSQDDLADSVADMWKHCVALAQIGKDRRCHFSAEILGIPGVAHSGQKDAGEAGDKQTAEAKVFRIGRGIAPPKLIFNKNPEFSEAARKAKFQGVVTVEFVVNEEGLPTHIRITSPVGYGLDAKAVEAVAQWRFKPAEKDGEPVPVQISAQVDFHLY
jgi:TonB family protein